MRLFPSTRRQRRSASRPIGDGMDAHHGQYQQRPGLAYILEGELVEHRNDHQGPIVRGVGAIAFERSGLVHYWKNESGRSVRALVVDIVDTGS